MFDIKPITLPRSMMKCDGLPLSLKDLIGAFIVQDICGIWWQMPGTCRIKDWSHSAMRCYALYPAFREMVGIVSVFGHICRLIVKCTIWPSNWVRSDHIKVVVDLTFQSVCISTCSGEHVFALYGILKDFTNSFHFIWIKKTLELKHRPGF